MQRKNPGSDPAARVEEVELALLEDAPFNARTMTEADAAKLAESLSEYGVVEPIVANRRKGGELRIVGGHQRAAALRKAGAKSVPCVVMELSDAMERRLLLRLNRNVGRWDWAKLGEMREEELLEAGFTEVELARHGVGTGGAELQVEGASGDAEMGVRLEFRTEKELAAAAKMYVGKDNAERTRRLLKSVRAGKLKA